MKKAALNIMNASGVFAPFRIANRNKAIVLMYHRFNAEFDPAAISAEQFERQLDYLQSRYKIVPLSYLAERLINKQPLPRALAVITIDDGYRDVYEVAMPLLRRRKLQATFFITTGFVDRKTWLWTDKMRYVAASASANNIEANIGDLTLRFTLNGRASRLQEASRLNEQLKQISDEEKEESIQRIAARLGVEVPKEPPAEFAPITWEQAREMERAGIEIGSHTVTHPILSNVSAERVRRELNESRSQLESALGHTVTLFCYPNGDMNNDVRSEVKRAGYMSAVATEYGFNDDRSDPFALRRIPAATDLARFAQSTSGFEQFRMKFKRAGLIATSVSSSLLQAHQ